MRTLWGVWAFKPAPIMQRLRDAVPCGVARCKNDAWWQYDGLPICDNHILGGSVYYNALAREFTPALKEIGTLPQWAGQCPDCIGFEIDYDDIEELEKKIESVKGLSINQLWVQRTPSSLIKLRKAGGCFHDELF